MLRRKCLPFVALFVIAVFMFSLVRSEDPKPRQAPAAAAAKKTRLVIDYGDGVEKHFTGLPLRDKMTVLDLLVEAKKHPRGIRFEYRGSAETGFLTQIDDLKNEGRGKNWTYRVNDQLGDRSFAVYPVEEGDVVLWKFAPR